MIIAVSACLLGENCKYNGSNNYHERLAEFVKGHQVIPLCPEVLGGLPVPREPAEIVGGVVRCRNGTSVDAAFRTGAHSPSGARCRFRTAPGPACRHGSRPSTFPESGKKKGDPPVYLRYR